MKPPHKLTKEEKALWERAMKNVTPLGQPVKSYTPTKQNQSDSEHIKPSVDIHLSNYYQEPVEAETILAYKKPDFPKKQFLDLKSGNIRFEAQLDLHGSNIESSKDELCNFLNIAKNRGFRCVLIIHGKGRQANIPPILKNHVNHWLKQLPDILAFHSALPKHGGTGAVYVYIKKFTNID